MNKLLYSIMAMSLLLLFSSISYAAAQPGGKITLGTTDTTTVTLSSGVYAGYVGEASTGATYGAATVNGKGINEYGLSSASAQIYYQAKPGATAAPTAPAAGLSTWNSSWIPMGQ